MSDVLRGMKVKRVIGGGQGLEKTPYVSVELDTGQEAAIIFEPDAIPKFLYALNKAQGLAAAERDETAPLKAVRFQLINDGIAARESTITVRFENGPDTTFKVSHDVLSVLRTLIDRAIGVPRGSTIN